MGAATGRAGSGAGAARQGQSLPGAVADRMAGHLFDRQRGHLFAWAPVMMGAGIGWYFALRFEPAPAMLWIAAAAAGCAALLAIRHAQTAPVFWALALLAAGFALAGARAHLTAAPVLGFRYYGPVEGRILSVDRSASDRLRLTLDRLRLDGVAPEKRPARVRISLHGPQRWLEPQPGRRVALTAFLTPPQGPAEPGGFDFRRYAWFQRLGAVGYTRSPALDAGPGRDGPGVALERLRLRLSRAVREAIPGQPGAFSAAILTGDRMALDPEMVADLRLTNLAHLLAISGLHMGLLSSVVFAAIRLILSAVPALALRLPVKKIAAAGALTAAAVYLLLSGASVATERAFVMVAMMLLAVLADRRALSLRAVALAALVVLLLRPEALLGPGFQMSFAATAGLVAVFAALRQRREAARGRGDGGETSAAPGGVRHRLMLAARPVGTLILASSVAGAATAPFSAAHFNALAQYGLLANLLAVPAMGFVVMPGAVLALGLWPFGLPEPGLWAMEAGVRWILQVASRIGAWEGARLSVPAPPGAVLPLLTAGMLVLMLWQGRARLLGIAGPALALALWWEVERPLLLISESGRLVGVLGAEGRLLNRGRGDGFVAGIWLENDGDPVSQVQAYARGGGAADGGVPRRIMRAAGVQIVVLGGKAPDIAADCGAGRLLLAPGADLSLSDGGECTIIDARRLRETGALAGWMDVDGRMDGRLNGRGSGARLVLRTAKQAAGVRLWSPAPMPRPIAALTPAPPVGSAQ